MVQLLLERGADVNRQRYDGLTALTEAAIGGYVDIAKLLIEAGADVNAKNSVGQTALTLALQGGYPNELIHQHQLEVAKLLKGAGAKP